jgi:hypothetical protein
VYTALVRIALLMTALGALLLFAIHGATRLSWIPWLDLHVAGVVLMIVGAGFGVLLAIQRRRRSRGEYGED